MKKYGKRYKVINDTYYSIDTPNDMVILLERLRNNEQRVTVRFGDRKTGRDWGETHDVEGYIGRSGGKVKIPLLISNRASMGGGGLLDAHLDKVSTSKGKKTLYKHKKYHVPKELKKEAKDYVWLQKRLKKLGVDL